MIGKTDIDATEGGVANTGTVKGNVITGITFEQHRAAVKEDLADLCKTLETAHASERDLLSKKIAELERKLTNIEQDYEQTLAELAKLKDELKQFSNTAPIDQLAAAMSALDSGDRTKADELLQQIEQSNIESAAHAIYLRGNIAAAEICWADAATLYSKAALLDPTYKHLLAAHDFLELAGQYQASISIGKQLLAAAMNEFGENSREHVVAINNHGLALQSQGSYQQAEHCYKQALEIDRERVGTKHPHFAIRLNNLAELYRGQGKYSSAEPLYLQALEIEIATHGLESHSCAISLSNLASLYVELNNFETAERLYKKSLEIGKVTIGASHPSYAIRLSSLAELYRRQGNYESAEPLYEKVAEIYKDTIGVEHPVYAEHLNKFALLYHVNGNYTAAQPLYKQAIEICENTLPSDHPQTKTIKANFAAMQAARDKG